MTPAALFLALFVAYPLLRLIADSFYKISPVAGGSREFIGFANYVQAFGSEAFTGAGWRTLVYTTIVVTAEFVLGLGMALLFTTLGKKSQIWRTVFMYPLMIAPIVAGLLWKFLMIDNFGLVGSLLYRAGILVRSQPDRLAVRSLDRPVLSCYSRYLAHDIVHVPGAFRGAAEHPRRTDRSGPPGRGPSPGNAVPDHPAAAAARHRRGAGSPGHRCGPCLRHHPHSDQRRTATPPPKP